MDVMDSPAVSGSVDEPESIDELCRAMYPRLVGAVGLFCGDVAVAEDAVQEAVAALWVRWERRRPAHPEAWCYRVAVNATVSAARRRGAQRRALSRLGPQARNSTDDAAEAVAVRDALQVLTKRQREAVIARFFLALSVEEAAESMRCRPGTVTALVHQGMERLREQPGFGGDDDA